MILQTLDNVRANKDTEESNSGKDPFKMQQRRAKPTSELPLTQTDASLLRNRKKSRSLNIDTNMYSKTRKNTCEKSSLPYLQTILMFTAFVILMILVLSTDWNLMSSEIRGDDSVDSKGIDGALAAALNFAHNKDHDDLSIGDDLPLSQFKSLDSVFGKTKLVALYFAASWCPMSSPITHLIDDYTITEDNGAQELIQQSISIVYVSSDETEQEFSDYILWNWSSIPFASPDRSALKRHFKTCAQREMTELGIPRRSHEIPTLMVLDGETRGVLTSKGVEDLNEYKNGSELLKHWLGLRDLVRAWEEKYD